MFEFTNPFLLYGLAAGIIPIIIHLIFRRRFQRVQWAAMKFLLAAFQKTRTSLLIENLLLLLLRVLIILLLVLTFTRPVIRTSAGLLQHIRTPQNYIILLDNSYSMGVRHANTSPFEQAKEQGRHIFEMMQSGDRISLLTMNAAPQVVLSFARERKEALQKFEQIELSHMGTDVIESIVLLASQVSNPEYRNKKVYIISDLQKAPWLAASKSKSFVAAFRKIQKQSASLAVIDVGLVRRPVNLTVTDLSSDGVIGTGILARFTATIKNNSHVSQSNLSVRFFVDGHPQQTQTIREIEAYSRQDVPFTTTFEQVGPHYISVELMSDNLAVDNKRYLAFEVVENIRVLAIDGDMREAAFESETDYFMAAIGPSTRNLIQAHAVDVALFGPGIKLRDYDILVMANVKILPLERLKEIEDFVRKGGSLWIFLGDKVEDTFQDYNGDLYSQEHPGLLPAFITGKPIGDARERENPFHLTKINIKHNALEYFRHNQPLLQDLQKAYIFRFFPVKPHPRAEVLATYNDPAESPAMVLKSYGKGKVLLFTTTADGDWTNLNTDQFGHVYLVMIHEFLQYLFAKPLALRNIAVKSPLERTYEYQIYKDQQSIEVILPNQDREPVGVSPDKEGNLFRVLFLDTDYAGIYTFRLHIPADILEHAANISDHDYFAVNVDPQEGQLERLTPQELSHLFPSIKFQYTLQVRSNTAGARGKKDIELWRWSLPLVIVLALLESILAMWFGQYEK